MRTKWSIVIVLAALAATLYLVLTEEKDQELPNEEEENTERQVFHEVAQTDVVQLHGKQYYLYSGILSHPEFLREEAGVVKANVFEEAQANPHYKLSDGDASFLPEGTRLYKIAGLEKFIAAASDDSPQGYMIYQENSRSPEEIDIPFIANQKIKKIEIYKRSRSPLLVNTISDNQSIYQFKDVLLKGQVHNRMYLPKVSGPTFYRVVFYSEGPIAESYSISYDGSEWYNGHRTFKGLHQFIPEAN
ncbi:hypothetical protein [Bacillus sp. SG-1]|uniref:hypothetical protein n=1 Tax=Bacillus sp. SG-1 TaxID=161544 RepID=UPI00015437B6|nr:hypothetical protein [Bacillus sp. SG-1]EDL66717.1 hypothetical protein BSG1_05155 [Bacillus sp. SG-1]